MIHPADYFDAIYCLNLDRRSDRWRQLKSRLRRWGLRAQRFAAIDGSEPSIAMQYRQLIGQSIRFNRRQRCYNISSPNAFACLLGHTGIVENALEYGYRRILVLEDDVLLHRNFLAEFQKVSRLPADWKLLYLGASQHHWQPVRRYGDSFYLAGESLGAFAVAVRSHRNPAVERLSGCPSDGVVAFCNNPAPHKSRSHHG